eukprot:Skav204266  [mRNA]  locus=scaffold912:272064:272576:- [translate_table: standard]
MAPVLNTKLMHHLDRALQDEDVEVLKRDLGLPDQEIRDIVKIVAKDNQRSDCLFALGRFFVAISAALAGGGGYLSHQGNFTTGFTLLMWAIVGVSIGICAVIASGLTRWREENHHSVARKLNRRFPQLHFTISKRKVKGSCCGPSETGWHLAVEKRKTTGEEELVKTTSV